MFVDQAIYGSVQNGHGLRCCSGDQKTALELANRLDLPDTAPPGADWSPFVSGFVHGDRYVLARTFKDTTATRAGMVVAHALICPLQEIIAIDNLSPMFKTLISDPSEAPNTVERIAVLAGDALPVATPELVDVARSLTVRGSGPVVRIGTAGFEDLVIAIWAGIWPSLRDKFSFRLSFGPGDIIEQPEPKLVCTPVSLLGRWQQHRIAGRADTSGSLAPGMIDGSDAGIPLMRFAKRIGSKLNSFEDLTLLEQAYLMASGEPVTFPRLLSAIRLIERISPDPADGEAEKHSLITRFVTMFPNAKAMDILALRNITLGGFPTGDLIWKALEIWVAHNSFPEADDPDFRTVLNDSLTGADAQKIWREGVSRGLENAASRSGNALQAGFWRWSAIDPSVSAKIINLIHDEPQAIEKLINTSPASLGKGAADPILSISAKLKLFRLHAVVASGSMEPKEAAKAQSKVEVGGALDTMRLALRKAKPETLVDIAREIPDSRVQHLASEAVAKNPSLLATHDMTLTSNRAVWESAIEMNAESWRGPADPRGEFATLLVELIAGQNPQTGLIDRLATSPLADVSSFSRRKDLWKHLTGDARRLLLDATVDKWLDRAGQGHVNADIEPELEKKILSDPKLDRILSKLSNGRIGEGLDLIAVLQGFDHARYSNWISNAVRATCPISEPDAERIGKMLSARGQRDVVDNLVYLFRGGRTDLKPALRYAIELVGHWDRWILGLSPLAEREKWESFIQIAAELYPNGPDNLNLWDRAGGRDSELIHHGSGLSRWRDAVTQMQRGKPPRVGQLVREMRKDYENNSNLRFLADDPLFSR
ncbi:GAP1-N1 domain-containing protein [Rhizobium sp. SL42]|uniref:GAP1-N1 domain-containing protein n=1 Tax=Rhizobium sp. SL42 TaxID=2806346 RepID=UPI001F321B22|nr:effector-associated domain EAD1-containing protein [Rhizobium sp. SL42]UJW77685.1 hypothetical protein IM739_22455 [Rhizobium sp. SL42]